MQMKIWQPGLSDKEQKHVGYWERNMLALAYADGWYFDDVEAMFDYPHESADGQTSILSRPHMVPRFDGWRRVLSLRGGAMCFHVPDDFEVGDLKQIERQYDGHTTEEKWRRLAASFGIELTLEKADG